MAKDSILQGTTPSLRIKINSEDLSVQDIGTLELTFKQASSVHLVKGLSDVTLDTDENSIYYHFTEQDTLSFVQNKPLLWQLRVQITDGEILGTTISTVDISELLNKKELL